MRLERPTPAKPYGPRPARLAGAPRDVPATEKPKRKPARKRAAKRTTGGEKS